MPCAKSHVTFFRQFTKLTEGDPAIWAVGYMVDEVVMTRLRVKSGQHPTVEDVPDGLLVMAHLTRWGTDQLRKEQFDFEKYISLQETIKETDAEIQRLTNKIRGVLFGQAIGDALGFGTEFLSKQAVLGSRRRKEFFAP